MSAKNPQAFPVPQSVCGGLRDAEQQGMTLRDYFAAKAMMVVYGPDSDDAWAKECYIAADAMLAARETA